MARLTRPIDPSATLVDAKDAWRASMTSAHKSPKTITTYLFALDRLIDYLGRDYQAGAVTRRDLEAMQGALLGRMKPSSVLVIYRALKVFWGWAVAHQDMPVEVDPMEGMKPPRVAAMVIEFVTDDELRAIIATCSSKSRHNYLGRRDEAIIRLLASTMARLSEIANLRVNDVDMIGATVRVMGKGRRERYLPMDTETTGAMRRYLDRERPRHPAAAGPLLWLSRGDAGMTPSGVAQMIAERGIKALGPDHRRVHPHELRHRQAATLLAAGFSEGDVMELGGWRNRGMLDRYGAYTKAKRAQDAFRRASATGALPKL